MFITFMMVTIMATAPVAEGLKRPDLTKAQGMVESGLNPKAKGKAGERGAWQVLEREHGKVPRHLKDQAKQAERILNELINENHGNHFEGLVKYNSYKNRPAGVRYAKKVIRKTFELILIG